MSRSLYEADTESLYRHHPGIPKWRLSHLADPEGNLVELVSRS